MEATILPDAVPGRIGGLILALTGAAPGVPLCEVDIDFYRRVPTQDINTNEHIDRGRGPKEKLTIQHSDN